MIPLETAGAVTFTVHRLKDRANKFSERSKFILSSLSQGDWVENCRGTISVDHRDPTASASDEDKLELQRYRTKLESARKRCFTSLHAETIYRYFSERGLDYDPSFQLILKALSDESNQTLSNLRGSPQLSDEQSHPHYVVHPSTLNATMQNMYIGLSKGLTDRVPTSVPTVLERIWISRTGLNGPAGAEFEVFAEGSYTSPAHSKSSLVAVNLEQDGVFIIAEELETTLVAESSSELSILSQEQPCHSLKWAPDISIMDNTVLLEYTRVASSIPKPSEFYSSLTTLLLMTISQTLLDISEACMLDSPHHLERYVEWMRLTLKRFEEGTVPDAPQFLGSSLLDLGLKDKLIASISEFSTEGRLFCEVSKNHTALVTNRINIHNLLFESDLAESYYREAYSLPTLKAALSRYIDALTDKNPTMQILEIGADTGSATEMVLDAFLGMNSKLQCSRYDFTDISPSFFEKAHEKFRAHGDKSKYRTLDAETDVVKQGFQENTYDLIIAFGSIHVTHSLHDSLTNLWRLLRP